MPHSCCALLRDAHRLRASDSFPGADNNGSRKASRVRSADIPQSDVINVINPSSITVTRTSPRAFFPCSTFIRPRRDLLLPSVSFTVTFICAFDAFKPRRKDLAKFHIARRNAIDRILFANSFTYSARSRGVSFAKRSEVSQAHKYSYFDLYIYRKGVFIFRVFSRHLVFL